jgi:hypothetical protein
MSDKDKQIQEQIEKIRSSFVLEDEVFEKSELSFLDRLNNLVQLILDDKSVSIYQALDKESLDRWHKTRFSRYLKNLFSFDVKNIFYMLLLVGITGFLVSEAVIFYADGSVPTDKTYFKAILTEVCFIFLSGFRSAGAVQTAAVSILRASIFSLMLFVITSGTFLQGTKTVENSNVIAEQITILQEQIGEKKTTIEFYRKKNWPITTKQLIVEKDTLVKKLIVLKEQQAAGANKEVSKLVKYKSYGKAFFRVMLLFISMLITRRIFKF